MFGHILSFEVRYQLRRPSTWLYVAILFLLTFGAFSSQAITIGGSTGKVLKNAPFVMANVVAIMTAVGQVITTALVGTAILRDYQARTHELLFTSSMTRLGYLGGRFAGATVIMLIVYLAIPLGAMLGSAMPWVDRELYAPFRLANYLQPFLVIGLTNVLFISALFFAAGALTRSQFVVYTMGIFLLVAQTVAQQLTKDLSNDWVGALLDPFGMRAFELMTRYWTVADRNTRLIPLEGFLLGNRVTWLLVAAVLVAATLAVFRFSAQPPQLGLPWRRKRAATPAAEETPGTPSHGLGREAAARLAAAQRGLGAPAWGAQLWAVTRLAFASMTRQVTFLAIATVGAINVFMTAWYVDQRDQVRVYPRTYLIADAIVGGFSLFFIILLTMFVGELVWRERQQNTDQIQDALPVGPGTHFLGRLAGLVGTMALLGVVLILTGMLVQVLKGYTTFELSVYLRTVFLIEFPFVLQYALLAFAVHVLVNNKAVGHVVLIGFWVLNIVLDTLGYAHPIYQFGLNGGYTYSDMNGYGHFIPRVATFVGWWLAVAALVGVAAYAFWLRGTEHAWRLRRLAARLRMGAPARLTMAGAGAGMLSLGGFALWNTNVEHTYRTRDDEQAERAEYERRYKRAFEGVQLPRPVAVALDADLRPEDRTYVLRGTKWYVNPGPRAVDTLPVTMSHLAQYPGEFHVDRLTWSRPARSIVADSAHGFLAWRLETPLAPGDSLRLDFAVRYAPRGFAASGSNTEIVGNGTFVPAYSVIPTVGYSRGAELTDDRDRKKQKLAPRPLDFARDDSTRWNRSDFGPEGNRVRFRATVRTAPDQIAIAPGYLRAERMENGRRVFEYEAEAPILNFYQLSSARYAVRKGTWRGPYCPTSPRDGCVPRDTTVEIAVYYQPGHEYNVDRMIASTQASLDYFARHYGPYQFRQVRILEFPRYASFAQSFPNTIPYSESIGFITVWDGNEYGLDTPWQVTAHEVAHQWWGHQVLPAGVQGSTMIVESLAEFTSMMVVEKKYGRHAMEKYMRSELDWYLRGRGTEAKRELPLALVEGQGYIRYGKGGLTLYALRDYIGEAAMNRALAGYVRRRGLQDGPPYTTTHELVDALRAETPDSLRYLIADLFETITLWDLKTEEATASKRPDGKWTVRLAIGATKVRADTAGKETPVPIADYVTVGVFGEPTAKDDKLGAPILLEKRRVDPTTRTIEVVVDREPVRAGLDPYHLLIDRDWKDNVRDVVKR